MKGHEEKIAIYSRKSKFTGKGESIGNQIELCRNYVRSMFGGDFADRCIVFEDEGFSGGNLRRPDFQKMMEQIRKGGFRAIVVYRLDRISRNISDFTGLIDELTKLNVAFVSIREQFDTGTPMGRAMMFIISVFSQLERETIAQRIRDNMQELAKTGRWLGGNTPTGYGSESISSVTVDGKTRKACRLKRIPEEAEIVKTIYDLYTQMDSLTGTEAELLRRRLKSKKGNDFSRFSIKAILKNPVYMIADEDAYQYLVEKEVYLYSEIADFDGYHGLMVYNRTDQEKGKAADYLPMTEWIVSVGKHPGLISAKQWIAVQQSLERNKSKAYRKPRTNEALLTGLLFCPCGGRMYPKLSGRKTEKGEAVYTYVCKMKERSKGTHCQNKNVNGNALDAAVLQQMGKIAADVKTFTAQLKKRFVSDPGEQGKPDTQISVLRTALAENMKKTEGLLDTLSLVNEPETKIQIVRRIEQLSENNREIEEQIRIWERECSANRWEEGKMQQLRSSLQDFSRVLEEMSVEEKRTAVRLMVQKVVWDGAQAHVLLWDAKEDGHTVEKAPWCEDSK